MEKHKGFEPIYDKESKFLILGSFPSVKSRKSNFYYANKRNRFWSMLEKVFNEKINDNIEEKKTFLKTHHLALWDIVEESDLEGSLDKSLEKSEKKIADLSFLLPPNTKIEKILCNGKTAFNLLQNALNTTIPVLYMPSTSSANAHYNFEEWKRQLI